MNSLKIIIDNLIRYLVNPALGLLMALAVVIFLWGVYKFIANSAEGGEAREEGARSIIWGLVGIFIMVSVFGIINLVLNVLNL